jgi:predicted RNA-binding Zn ribbon-like protein
MLQHETAPSPGFSFRSDRLCLDFAATLMFRDADQPQELLDSPARLSAWAQEGGIVSDPIASDAPDLSEATSLREAIYRTAVARISEHRPGRDDLVVLNRHGQVAPTTVALSNDATITRAGTMAAVLANIARDAIQLLGGPDADRLRQCGRKGCTRLFVDRSHGRNRTWCGMRECGNRVNAAAYRQRHLESRDPR